MCDQRPERSDKRESCEKLISREISSPYPAAARIALGSDVLPSLIGRTNQNAGTRPRRQAMHGAPSDSFARRQIFGTKERKFSVSQRNRRGRGKPVNVQQPKLSGVVLSRLPVPPLHRAARMADRRPLLAIAGALAANGRALAQTSAAAKGDPVTVQGDVQDAQREVGAGAVCGLRNAERFTGRQGIWAMAATIATAVRTSPTANSMLAAVAQFRTTSIPDGRPVQSSPIGPPVCTAPRAWC